MSTKNIIKIKKNSKYIKDKVVAFIKNICYFKKVIN